MRKLLTVMAALVLVGTAALALAARKAEVGYLSPQFTPDGTAVVVIERDARAFVLGLQKEEAGGEDAADAVDTASSYCGSASGSEGAASAAAGDCKGGCEGDETALLRRSSSSSCSSRSSSSANWRASASSAEICAAARRNPPLTRWLALRLKDASVMSRSGIECRDGAVGPCSGEDVMIEGGRSGDGTEKRELILRDSSMARASCSSFDSIGSPCDC